MPTVDKNAFALFMPHLPWIKFTLLNVKRNTMQERTILRSSGWNKIYRKFNVTFLHGQLLMRLAKLQLFPIESWSEVFQLIPTSPVAYWYIVNWLKSTVDDDNVYQNIQPWYIYLMWFWESRYLLPFVLSKYYPKYQSINFYRQC